MQGYCFDSSGLSSKAPALRPWRRCSHLLVAVAALGLLHTGQAAAQQAGTPDSAQAGVPAKPNKSRKVCRLEDVTGSRMKKRVCYTPGQAEALERAAKEAVRELDAKPVGAKFEGSGT